MNLLLFGPEDRIGDSERFRVDGVRAAHIRTVLGAEPGRTLKVGLLDGPLGRGVVRTISESEVELECSFETVAPPRPRTDLIVAIPRPKSLKKLLPEIAALGVDRVVLLRTWRVAQPYLSSPLLVENRGLLLAGLMQSGLTHLPRITVEPRFRPFVEDRAAEMFADASRLVAHPAAAEPLARVRLSPESRVALAIGPEGGWIEPELGSLERAGFEAVSMGPKVLRVETACVALLAQIDLLRGLGARSDGSPSCP